MNRQARRSTHSQRERGAGERLSQAGLEGRGGWLARRLSGGLSLVCFGELGFEIELSRFTQCGTPASDLNLSNHSLIEALEQVAIVAIGAPDK